MHGSSLRMMATVVPSTVAADAAGQRRWPFTIWQISLLFFIIAAATGAFLRFGLMGGLPYGLLFTDVRHAHSHLMFFGWVTPVLMLVLLRLQGNWARPGLLWLLIAALLFAAASFVPFLLSGYRLMPLFGRDLPVSMIVSGLNGLVWYAFIAIYLWRDRKREPDTADRYLRMSVWLLLASSLGIVALAAAGMQGAGSVLINSLAYFFLELFAEGWFGLAVIGLAYQLLPAARSGRSAVPGMWLLAAGLTGRTLADVFVSNGVPGMQAAVLAGSAVAGLGLLLALLPLLRVLLREPFGGWHVSLGLLAAKGVFDLLLAHPVLHQLSDSANLRVFYLHALLLGSISIGLITCARRTWGRRAFRFPWLFTAAVLVMIAALLPVSGAWPAAWSGIWVLQTAAWTSLGPVALGLLAFVLSFRA